MKNTIKSESHSVTSNSLQPHGLYGPWNSLGQNVGVGSRSLLQGIFPIQELNPGLGHYRRNSIPAEPLGKTKNTGVGSLSLLQWTFLTQESNQGSPALQTDSLPVQLPGKPEKKNIHTHQKKYTHTPKLKIGTYMHCLGTKYFKSGEKYFINTNYYHFTI